MSVLAKGFRVTKCERCGTPYFPRRLICRKCGHDSWIEHIHFEAVIEESTVIRHVAGMERTAARHLATVTTGDGLHLVVGLDASLADGTLVELYEQDGAPVARVR